MVTLNCSLYRRSQGDRSTKNVSMKKLLISTRKGLVEYHRSGNSWNKYTHHFEAIPVTYSFVDPIHGHWWACLDHGHWGIKLHRTMDEGKSWAEMEAPSYPEGFEVKETVPAKTEYLWSMASGGRQYPDRLWMGTIPGGLFKSEDNGITWSINLPLWNHPSRKEQWFGAGFDHPGIHSILVDPRDNDHIVVGISVAGVFETKDGGKNWNTRNKGLIAEYLPDSNAEVGQDPHLVVRSKSSPDIMWQQNHCGIFQTMDGGMNWNAMSKQGDIAHFGFAIAVDDDHPEVAFVAPAKSDEYRVAINQALCICKTEDGGRSWRELRNGLPQENCFDIVYRHGLAISGKNLAFGTTTGNVFYSNNSGEEWKVLSNYLPLVHAVTFAP